MSQLFQRFGNRKIVTTDGSATMEFDRGLQKAFTALEQRLDDITALQTQQTAQLASITTLQADMLTRITEIEAAQAAADVAHRNDSISSSWTSPGTILSAADAGTDATITIANHTRKYGDATSVAVTGAAITALAYSATYQVYYDDATRAGGAVAFQSTSDPNVALPNAVAGRHYCGEIATPASGGAATSGGVSPPGSGGQLNGTDIP